MFESPWGILPVSALLFSLRLVEGEGYGKGGGEGGEPRSYLTRDVKLPSVGGNGPHKALSKSQRLIILQ